MELLPFHFFFWLPEKQETVNWCVYGKKSLKEKKETDVVAHTCNPNYVGGRGRTKEV
jgi:hypothetical protein